MEQTKFNTVLLIGVIVTITSFGGGMVGYFTTFEKRLSVIEYKADVFITRSSENAKDIRDLQMHPNK